MIQNVRLLNGNFTRVDGYFYSFDEDTDTMIQKTDDGTLAFAYPLDTPIAREVVDLTFDGESWWTMESISATPADGFTIKRWIIANFVMVLQQTFSFATDSNDTFESTAFAVETYEGIIQAFGQENSNQLTVSFSDDIFAQITAGTTLFLVMCGVGYLVIYLGVNEVNKLLWVFLAALFFSHIFTFSVIDSDVDEDDFPLIELTTGGLALGVAMGFATGLVFNLIHAWNSSWIGITLGVVAAVGAWSLAGMISVLFCVIATSIYPISK